MSKTKSKFKQVVGSWVIPKIASNKLFMTALLQVVLVNKKSVLILIGSLFVITIIDTILPYWYGELTDQLVNNSFSKFQLSSITLLICFRIFFKYLNSYHSLYTAKKITLSLKEKLINYTIDISSTASQKFEKGDIIQRVFTEIGYVQKRLIFGSIEFAKSMVFLVIILINIYLLSKIALASILAIGLLIYLFNSTLWKKIETSNTHLQKYNSKLSSAFLEILSGKKEIFIYNLENKIKNKITPLFTSINIEYQKNASLKTKGDVFAENAMLMFVVALAFILTQNDIGISSNVTLISFVVLMIGPVRLINEYISNLHVIVPSVERIDKFLRAQSDIPKKEGSMVIEEGLSNTLILKNIYFSYVETRIFDGLNLELQDGFHLICGSNGKGKTTLVELISGLLIPDKGLILIKYPLLKEEYPSIVLVRQDAFFFDSSLMDNIKTGNNHIDSQEIKRIVNGLELGSFFERLTLNERIGENGIKLSGGQKQIFNIIRGVVLNSPILILDEPSNNIPANIIVSVLKRLRELRKNKITIIISHRDFGIEYDSITQL